MINKIKITFIISNLGQGGAERQLIELVKNIDKNLYDVSLCLYAINKGIFFKEVDNISGINLIKNHLHQKNKILKILEAILFIHKYLKKNKFDIVHTSLFMNGALVRLYAPRNYKNRIVYNVRTSFNLYNTKLLLLERLLINKSYLITNSKSAYKDFVKYFPKKYKAKMHYIYNGFDTEKFKPATKQISKKITIGSVGRIHHLKNHLQILRVFNGIENTKLRLMIIGDDGGEKQYLENFISANNLTHSIELLPQQKKIEEYYNKFDIFILSSLLEGCPNVLFEAMLCKCFCIISKNANSDDFVIDGLNGLVYNGTDDDLKVKLEYAINMKDSDKFEKIRETGYEYAKNNFSMKKMVESYENLYSNILNNGKVI
jgi:glycosyltransferase involved in cell wall biosynthesis